MIRMIAAGEFNDYAQYFGYLAEYFEGIKVKLSVFLRNGISMKQLLGAIKGTIFHPQWLSDRYHTKSKRLLLKIRDSKVLDIGSGNIGYKQNIHNSNLLYTLDYPSTNERYRVRPNIFADARCLPIHDNEFDVVFLFEVLEHVAEPEKVLKEIRRVLRPGGKFYLSVPFIYPIHDAPNDYWRFTVYGIQDVLRKHGFEVVDLIVHGNTLVSACQMFNLGLLEICRDLYLHSKLLGLLTGLLAYPFTFVINVLALPLLYLPLGKAGSFGCFLISRQEGS